jgi:hypothetical protein
MKAVRTTLFGLAMALALGFGASTVLANPAATEDGAICPRTSVGKCSNQDQCSRKCASGSGSCTNGCCYCPL